MGERWHKLFLETGVIVHFETLKCRHSLPDPEQVGLVPRLNQTSPMCMRREPFRYGRHFVHQWRKSKCLFCIREGFALQRFPDCWIWREGRATKGKTGMSSTGLCESEEVISVPSITFYCTSLWAFGSQPAEPQKEIRHKPSHITPVLSGHSNHTGKTVTYIISRKTILRAEHLIA